MGKSLYDIRPFLNLYESGIFGYATDHMKKNDRNKWRGRGKAKDISGQVGRQQPDVSRIDLPWLTEYSFQYLHKAVHSIPTCSGNKNLVWHDLIHIAGPPIRPSTVDRQQQYVYQ